MFLFAALSFLVFLGKSTAQTCTGVINSLDDVAAAVKCTTVILNGFTVPAGQGLTLNLLEGSTVDMQGDISFGNLSWAGPLFTISGKSIAFNGNAHIFDGGGPFYWDGLGGNGGLLKPAPMMKIKISGVYSNVTVINAPERAYSVSNPGPLVMTDLLVDDSQGDFPNDQSNGLPAGHNTDGFDCSTTNLVIQNSVVKNQDDCLAINKGSNITFTGNLCSGGHGISVGSIASDVVVNDIFITNNTVVNSDQALRIKMDATSTNSSISNITYAGNTATGMRQFGVLFDQSYPSTLKTPGNGVNLSGVNFILPVTKLTVNDDAERLAINCGIGSCIGTWDLSLLDIEGGVAGPINNFTGVVGFSDLLLKRSKIDGLYIRSLA
ncbi:endo-polygalacturonase PG1 [Cyathus striatus]|nr:endo-polygalacturonase PG1 [Cyathus striatus]